jgi:hypothetical protein
MVYNHVEVPLKTSTKKQRTENRLNVDWMLTGF